MPAARASLYRYWRAGALGACLGAGIVATTGANLAHGLGHGPIGALVSAWPALALAGSFELLMTMVRNGKEPCALPVTAVAMGHPVPVPAPGLLDGPSLEQTVLAWHEVGHSQRARARELNIDRRKVQKIIEPAV